jgi:hypothetical protein
VVVDGEEIPCEQFRSHISAPVMSLVDAMPAEWRTLIHEFGADAHQMFDESVPAFSHQKPTTATEARRSLERIREMAERKLGRRT